MLAHDRGGRAGRGPAPRGGDRRQAEIDIRFGTLVQTADRLMLYKYIVKNVCHRLGYTATFMPKPLFGDNGSGMHCHQSLWRATRRSSSTPTATR